MTPTLLLILFITALAAIGLALFSRARSRRDRAVKQLLDAADALEARLRAAREEIEAIAGDEFDPVHEAMREMLRQRLWLQQHGHGASLNELNAIRASIDGARARIDQQLAMLERARAALH